MKAVNALVPIEDLDRAFVDLCDRYRSRVRLDDGELSELVNNPPAGGFSCVVENSVAEPPPNYWH